MHPLSAALASAALLAPVHATAAAISRVPAVPALQMGASPLPTLSGRLAVSSGFLTDLRLGAPALPRFDAEFPAPLPVAAPGFRLEAPAPVTPPDSAPAPVAAPAPAPRSPLDLYRRVAADSPSALDGLAPSQMMDLWTRAYNHKIAGLDDEGKLKKYDPDGIIGFCFGRAMTVHLLARQMGLPQDRIKKLFVIGDLRSADQPEWRFHVTTLVQGADGRWHAIDPIMDGPLTADEWIAAVHQGWDRGKKAKFYLTDADAVIPDLSVVPDLPKETAAKIIELAFDPEGKPGFTKWAGARETVYEVDSRRRDIHLRSAGSPVSGFDFIQIAVNDMVISYNGYFPDLLAEIVSPSLAGPRTFRPKGAPASPALGLRVDRLRKDN